MDNANYRLLQVALFTRAWIEMPFLSSLLFLKCVALFTRAWIEIHGVTCPDPELYVALFTRAWIEMVIRLYFAISDSCRPLHEGVD